MLLIGVERRTEVDRIGRIVVQLGGFLEIFAYGMSHHRKTTKDGKMDCMKYVDCWMSIQCCMGKRYSISNFVLE